MMPFIDLSILTALFVYTSYASFTVLEPRARTVKGYDCGKIFFTDMMVQYALANALTEDRIDTVQKYTGPLYEAEKEYFVLPIATDESLQEVEIVPKWAVWRMPIYQVVFDIMVNVIDLIVMVANNDFATCSRVDNTLPEAQESDMEPINGYYCGHKLISNVELEASEGFARPHIGKGHPYPGIYTGQLYNVQLGYMIWPIYRASQINRTPKGSESPYFIVIDARGQLKDVIVLTIDNDFVKCKKSTGILSEFTVIALDENLGTHSISGFACGQVFFPDSGLELASQQAKRSRAMSMKHIYPKIYSGPPFYSPCLLWPIKPSSRHKMKARMKPYRLVLTIDYKILTVVIHSKGEMKRCERKISSGDVPNHDKNDYLCGTQVFYHRELVLVAESICNRAKARSNLYPQKYEEDTFEVEGPYLIYPIFKGTLFWRRPGIYRLVTNSRCEVAGALIKDEKSGKYVKCEGVWEK